MRNFKIIAVLSALLFATACAGGVRSDSGFRYLNAGMVSTINLPEVPEKGSALFDADFKTLHDWQDKRTQGQCDAAKADSDYAFVSLFPMMKSFYSSLPQRNREFIDSVGDEVRAAVEVMKAKYDRERPYVTDTTLTPCIGKMGKKSRAYPSGHTSVARVYAMLLTELMPDRRAEFFTRADEIAESRVISGVHHPTDIEAGKRLAVGLFPKYMQNKLFRANVNDLRQYIK